MIEKTGLSKEEMNEGARLVKIMMERVENKEKEMRRIKIDSSTYNGIYKTIKTEEVLEYVKERRGKKERSCGNEARGSQEWEEEEQRKCRVCGRERESLKHIVKECETRSEMTIEEFLKKDGKGKKIMERINRVRKV